MHQNIWTAVAAGVVADVAAVGAAFFVAVAVADVVAAAAVVVAVVVAAVVADALAAAVAAFVATVAVVLLFVVCAAKISDGSFSRMAHFFLSFRLTKDAKSFLHLLTAARSPTIPVWAQLDETQ